MFDIDYRGIGNQLVRNGKFLFWKRFEHTLRRLYRRFPFEQEQQRMTCTAEGYARPCTFDMGKNAAVTLGQSKHLVAQLLGCPKCAARG